MILHLFFGEIPYLTWVLYTPQPWWCFFVWSDVFFQVRHHGLRWKFVCKVRPGNSQASRVESIKVLQWPVKSSAFFCSLLGDWNLHKFNNYGNLGNEWFTPIQLESLHLIHTINHPKTDKFQTEFLCCCAVVGPKSNAPIAPHFDMQHMEAVEVFACSKSGGRNFAGFGMCYPGYPPIKLFEDLLKVRVSFPKSHELPFHFGDSWIWCNRTLSWICFFKFITFVWIFCLPFWFFHDFLHFILLCCATGRPVTRLRLGFPLVANCGKVEVLRNLWAKESSLKGWKMFFSRFPTESYPPTQGFGMFFYKALSRETWEFNEPNVVPVISGDVLSSNVEEPRKLRHGGMDWIMAWFG